jgi:hypothetical protein
MWCLKAHKYAVNVEEEEEAIRKEYKEDQAATNMLQKRMRFRAWKQWGGGDAAWVLSGRLCDTVLIDDVKFGILHGMTLGRGKALIEKLEQINRSLENKCDRRQFICLVSWSMDEAETFAQVIEVGHCVFIMAGCC